jgi:hypothetical protein
MSTNKSRPKAAEGNSRPNSSADQELAGLSWHERAGLSWLEALARTREMDRAWFAANPTRMLRARRAFAHEGPAHVLVVVHRDFGGYQATLRNWDFDYSPPETVPDDAVARAFIKMARLERAGKGFGAMFDGPEGADMWRWFGYVNLWHARAEGEA